MSLEQGLSQLMSPEREVRRSAAEAVTVGLEPGLRTRAFVFNTLLVDKATDDRLRNYPSWIASRNLANEASDESVQALVDAVQSRYDLPQRWYSLKAQLLGLDRIADYDRMASVASSDEEFGWDEARRLVLDAYASFSPEMAKAAERFFAESWIDAPMRPGKRPGRVLRVHGAQSASVPAAQLDGPAARRAHARARDGARPPRVPRARAGRLPPDHAAHAGRDRVGVRRDGHLRPACSTPPTIPRRVSRLLAESLEGQIATVFRQVAMNRFEDRVHTQRRDAGELSVEQFNEVWTETQTAMLGDSVEITDGYRTWWSYIPHFMGTPGYVYAYAYGQLLALSVYRAYEERGDEFVPQYLELLAAGGSRSPQELGQIVGLDLADPGFWSGGLEIVAEQLDAAEAAAKATGRL